MSNFNEKRKFNQLREDHYFKTGRKNGLVFEATDRLSANLFDDNSKISANIFNKDAKIRFTIIDSKLVNPKTGKGTAVYYSLDPNEVLLLVHILSDGALNAFMHRVGAYNALSPKEQISLKHIVETFSDIDFRRFDSMLTYKDKGNFITFNKNIDIGNNQLLVRKMTISYEKDISADSKWKLMIEDGAGVKDNSKGNGLNIIKTGTYRTTNKVQILLEPRELIVPISEAAKRVIHCQPMFYYLMKKEQAEFTRIKVEQEDYNGERIDEWNAKGKPKVYAKKEPTNSNQLESKNEIANNNSRPSDNLVCKDCGAEINQTIENYSKKHFGRALCYKCQEPEKEKRRNK